MKSVDFEESNIVLGKDQPEYENLYAHMNGADPCGRTTFLWELSWKDRLRLLFSGRIWHQVMTFNQPLQPQLLSVDKLPIVDEVETDPLSAMEEDWDLPPEGSAVCPHGCEWHECNECAHKGDIEYDAWREHG